MDKNGIKSAVVAFLIAFAGGVGALASELGATLIDIKTLPLAGLCTVFATSLAIAWQSYNARVLPPQERV